MDSVIRITVLYFFLLVMFRISGKRTLADSTPFDLVVVMIIGDLVQGFVVKDDNSMTNCLIIIVTLIFLEIGLSLFKHYFKKIDNTLEGLPLIIVDNGKVLKERMDKVRIEESDILESARINRGYINMSQVKYAVLEKNGTISIIGYD